MKKRILLGSPIHQKPLILKEFLQSLKELRKDTFEMDYAFVDDNSDKESSSILNEFEDGNSKIVLLPNESNKEKYICDDVTHIWKETMIWKVAAFKDNIINYGKENEYDYIFFIDSDIVLHPDTVEHLMTTQKDIISEIFWTKWQPEVKPMPQVWLSDQYTLYKKGRNEVINEVEAKARQEKFVNMLKSEGVFEVGGLGACTLISKKAIQTGVSFSEIKNISLWGEDRHFCVRAQALGFDLFVDTKYPAYHIYRESDLKGVAKYKRQNKVVTSYEEAEKAKEIIEQGIKSLSDFHYKKGFLFSWNYFFTDQLNAAFSNRAVETIRNIKEKLILTTTVKEIEFTRFDSEKAIASVKVASEGMKKGEGFYEEEAYEIQMVRTSSKEWKMVNITHLGSCEVDKMPFLRNAKLKDNKLTLSMVVKNEANRYLKEVLEAAREIIDEAVIIDDGSEDETISVIKEVLFGIPLTLIENKKSKFSNEVELRKQQWEETIKTNPDWILSLDADEILEKRAKDEIRTLLDQQDTDVWCFRLFDFWDEENYREDQYWCAHLFHRPFLVRYQKGYDYQWKETAQHCGRMPENIVSLPVAKSDLRVKHLGWAKEEERIKKYERYKKLDPESKYGWKEQYESILDKNPRLIPWKE